MDTQRSPDELTAENELICEKLLGWKPAPVTALGLKSWYPNPYGDDGEQWRSEPTPSFDTWAEAGLILEALTARRDHGWCLGDAEPARDVRCFSMGIHGYKYNAIRQTGPEAIRDAALYFIRSLP